MSAWRWQVMSVSGRWTERFLQPSLNKPTPQCSTLLGRAFPDSPLLEIPDSPRKSTSGPKLLAKWRHSSVQSKSWRIRALTSSNRCQSTLRFQIFHCLKSSSSSVAVEYSAIFTRLLWTAFQEPYRLPKIKHRSQR